MLQPRFGLDLRSRLPLAEFQREAVARCLAILRGRGGVIVADSVGLGKTFVGLGIIEAMADTECTLIVPAALRPMWRQELKQSLPFASVRIVSHQAVSCGRIPSNPTSVTIIDEAHAFRNTNTRRYKMLREFAQSTKLVLLTATPVNNSIRDLYALLKLFCADGAFADVGVGSLREALLGETVHAGDLERIKRSVIIRRTRAQVRNELGESRFPGSVATSTVSYEPAISCDALERLILQLKFPGRASTPELLQHALLKRIDSSIHAARITLRRQIYFIAACERAALHGRGIDLRAYRALFVEEEAAMQLAFDSLVETPHLEASSHESFARELATLRELQNALPTADDKLQALKQLLNSRRLQKTVVFTEYRDTARYLWQNLRNRYATGLIDGEGAWLGQTPANRRSVVECFAPLANKARIREHEVCNVLIATDVLAEGLNLQDSNCVVSYDLPWNPVKLVQRSGRVDRFGSAHDHVEIFNFIPDRDFDRLLRLAQRLREKFETLHTIVGLDRKVFDAELLDAVEPHPNVKVKPHLERPQAVTGIPVSTYPGPTLVGLGRGAHWQIEPADEFVDAAIEMALGMDQKPNTMPERLDRLVAGVLADLKSHNHLASVGRKSVGVRLAARVRQVIGVLPLGDGDEIYKRADTILAEIARVKSAGVEAALERIAVAEFSSASQLFDAIEAALEHVQEDEWTVTGVLVNN